MIDYEPVLNVCKNNNCKVYLNEPMKDRTTFNIGGNADVFIEIRDIVSLKNILKTIKNIPYYIIGKGSNILVSDEGLRAIVIKLTGDFEDLYIKDKTKIVCGAGVALSTLCKFAQENSLSGLEFAFGIPGTVGGAIYMNAGAYGGEIKDVLYCCNHLDDNYNNITLYNENIKFDYRKSIYSETNNVITQAVFDLKIGNSTDIKNLSNDYLNRRKTKQPLDYPSAGSVFKRPKGNFASKVIDECGLKGMKKGGAMVSTKHAGFLINYDNATCDDVMYLIEYIKKKVKEEKGTELKCEIKKLG